MSRKTKRSIWTPALVKRLKALYPKNNTRKVAEKLGIGYELVRSFATRIGLKKHPTWNKWANSSTAVSKKTRNFIALNYLKYTTAELMKMCNVSEGTVQRVRREYSIEGKVNTGRFKKGIRPHNKGKKSPGVSYGRMKETQFKKGQLPSNTLKDLAVTIRYDHPKTRSGRAYKWIRISKGKWIHYHRYLWEKANGPVPPKHMVAFRDGDSLNCRLSNLKMITMAENARRNYDPAKAQRAAKDLTDNYIAGRIAAGDKHLKKALILEGQDLIKLKRSQLLLKRAINHERHNSSRKNA